MSHTCCGTAKDVKDHDAKCKIHAAYRLACQKNIVIQTLVYMQILGVHETRNIKSALECLSLFRKACKRDLIG